MLPSVFMYTITLFFMLYRYLSRTWNGIVGNRILFDKFLTK